MPESERKSRWKTVVCCIVLMPVLYWFSAPVTLWVVQKTVIDHQYQSRELWAKVYEPVLWISEQTLVEPIALKPFEWLGIENALRQIYLVRFLKSPEGSQWFLESQDNP